MFTTAPPSEPPVQLFSRPALGALALLLILVGVLIFWRGWNLSAAANRPLFIEPVYPVDLNNATLAELELLPAIGPTLVKALDDYRRKNGGFHDVSDLLEIKGIGPILYDQLKDRVAIGPPPQTYQERESAVVFRAKPTLAEGATIDPNTASVDDLTRLPGIGPTLAGRIAESRKGARFASADDLRRVRGVGAKTLENVRPFIQIAP